MEGKYTKLSAIAGLIALVIAIWQFIPKSKKNYSGLWTMHVQIEEAKLSQYKGMTVDWILHITQSENQISGTAEKISVNSVDLNFRDRTTLSLHGSLEENKFVINYEEKGKLRQTTGMLNGEFINETFSGVIYSTASDSKGKISGHKQ